MDILVGVLSFLTLVVGWCARWLFDVNRNGKVEQDEINSKLKELIDIAMDTNRKLKL